MRLPGFLTVTVCSYRWRYPRLGRRAWLANSVI